MGLKLLGTLFYLFIIGSMILSLYYAPTMFIQQNPLAGWLWILMFVLFLLFFFHEGIRRQRIEVAKTYENGLEEIIGWICIMGQWIFILYVREVDIWFEYSLILAGLAVISSWHR